MSGSGRRGASGYGGSPLVDEAAEWLADQALGSTPVGSILSGCCDRLVAAGLPLWRSYLAYRTLHPLFASISLIWRRGQQLGTISHLHEEAFTSEQWLRSPMNHLLERSLPFLRRRLTGREAMMDFPLLEELKGQGGTDYLAYAVPFTTGAMEGPETRGVLGSWATQRRGGFSERDVHDLMRIQRRLAVACKVQIKDQTARNVLDTYLGLDAGRKVLEGRIRRGDGEQVHAVLWFSDMRGSTRLADALSSRDFLDLVNSYFECTAGAVLTAGGEVLRFIGDAVLAIFPISENGDGPAEACARALTAARDADARVAQANVERRTRRLEDIDYGLALHVGDVLYGNIGVPQRLEFSVVGPAANEAARLESLTKTLHRRLLLSEEFVTRLPGPYRSLGRHRLRGVGEEMEVFTPREELAAGR